MTSRRWLNTRSSRDAQRAQAGNELLVHFSGQNHQRHVAGLGVGDAQSVDELALFAKRLQHARQLRAAAVDHGNLVAVARQFCNCAGTSLQKRRNFKASSTQFDDILHSKPSEASFIRDLPRRFSFQAFGLRPAEHDVHILDGLT